MAKLKANNLFILFMEFFFMAIGASIAAFAIENFLVPNTILDGGITGISIILSKLTPVKLSVFIVLINIPFIYIGYKNLGHRFLIKALFSMILFSILLEVFHEAPNVTKDILLAMVYGGVLLGVGVGLIIKFGGCVDGTESVAIVISKKTSLSVGQIVLMFNLVIFTVAGFIFGIDRALYSLLTYFITYKVIDLVNDGLEQAKEVMIISESGVEIANLIYKRIGRTCTLVEGAGLVSGSKQVLYVVVTRLEVSEIRRIVEEVDGSAFVTVKDVSEIIGKHIKSTKEEKNLSLKEKKKRRFRKDK